MYVALRDLRRARGRFALIALVVVMVALLVTFLSGLTAGLAHQNISAVQQLPGTSVAFADTGAAPSFDESSLTATQVEDWVRAEPSATPVGIARQRIESVTPGAAPLPVALIGVGGGNEAGGAGDATPSGTVDLSAAAAADLNISAGGSVRIGDRTFTVRNVVGDDWYAHSPVVYVSLDDWQALTPTGGAATVVTFTPEAGTDTQRLARDTQTTVLSAPDALTAMPSYQAENGSLTLMTVLLFVISALVIGAFFTVWTVQRVPDVAVLKALGASTSSLVRDALGQASVVLVVGTLIGMGVAALAGGLIGAIPFVVSASTTLLPAAAIIGLGLLGACLALRFLITTDPLTALGGNR
ncbi:ABC transporter permease [Gordonia sinesedis]